MRVFTWVAVAVLASTALTLSAAPAWAQRGGGGGGRGGGGGGFGGGYGRGGYGGYGRGGYGGYGGYGGFGYGYGFGLGVGLYLPYYGYGAYAPYYGTGTYYSAYPPVYGGGYAPDGSAGFAPSGQPAPQRPAPDDLAHLQLMVPENAEVLLDGTKTTQAGTTREFVTPSLKPGSQYSYKITVRYTDATGKTVEDARDIRFQANDWFSIDFTRPPPTPAPLPKPSKQE
jgi:uncharacterized protein (TIGR03000 family)